MSHSPAQLHERTPVWRSTIAACTLNKAPRARKILKSANCMLRLAISPPPGLAFIYAEKAIYISLLSRPLLASSANLTVLTWCPPHLHVARPSSRTPVVAFGSRITCYVSQPRLTIERGVMPSHLSEVTLGLTCVDHGKNSRTGTRSAEADTLTSPADFSYLYLSGYKVLRRNPNTGLSQCTPFARCMFLSLQPTWLIFVR